MTTALQTLAVQSVQERGFYDERAIPDLARNPLLAAQVLRLDEEDGELSAAVAGGASPEKITAEAADVAIVAFQIAHLTGQTMRQLQPGLGDDYLRPESVLLLALHASGRAGELCRALRKNSPHLIEINLGLLWLALTRLAAACGCDLADAILAKLDADSVRGFLHGDPLPVGQGQSRGDLHLSDLVEEHNVYLSGPTLSGGALRDVPGRALNHHIWQSEQPGQYSHNGQGVA